MYSNSNNKNCGIVISTIVIIIFRNKNNKINEGWDEGWDLNVN